MISLRLVHWKMVAVLSHDVSAKWSRLEGDPCPARAGLPSLPCADLVDDFLIELFQNCVSCVSARSVAGALKLAIYGIAFL